jgi:hypothetical protein
LLEGGLAGSIAAALAAGAFGDAGEQEREPADQDLSADTGRKLVEEGKRVVAAAGSPRRFRTAILRMWEPVLVAKY